MDDLSERQGEVVREFLPLIGTRDKVERALETAMVPVFAILAAGWVVTEPRAWPYAFALTALFVLLCLRFWRFRQPMRYVFRTDGERLECVQGSVPTAVIDHLPRASLKMVGLFGESVLNPSAKGLSLLVLSQDGTHLEVSPRSHPELVDWILALKTREVPADPR